jgi:hypothetical protein
MVWRYLFILIISLAFGCKKPATALDPARSYRMGFMNSAPRYDQFDLFLQSLNLWTSRADAATITLEVPWDSLYAGKSPASYINNNLTGLVSFYRSKNQEIWISIDPQNGLDRTSDAVELKKMGKSIADAEVQQRYQLFVLAMDSILKPTHIGLAMETNLIRLAAPSSIYQGVKIAASGAAQALKQRKSSAKISVSVQAETAWGRLQRTNQYIGVEQDFTDFPFIEELGISSYPYFGYNNPDDIPNNYYTQLLNNRNLPVYVAEGGWATTSFTAPNAFSVNGSEEVQGRYFRKHHTILNQTKALAWFQLVFTDIDLSALPPQVDPSIVNFASLGLVTTNFTPKSSFKVWDSLYALQRKP